MGEVDASVFAHLRDAIKGGFDEERFGSRIGFGNLKRFLEEELARRCCHHTSTDPPASSCRCCPLQRFAWLLLQPLDFEYRRKMKLALMHTGMMHCRYREAAPATLALLADRCDSMTKDLLSLEARLAACTDVAALRKAGDAAG